MTTVVDSGATGFRSERRGGHRVHASTEKRPGAGFVCSAFLAVALATISAPSIVWATNVIDGCGQTCEADCSSDPNCREAVSGKCILNADVSCDSGDSAIELLSGNDLDLQGYEITCTETSPNSCNYSAISVLATGSKITSDGSGDDGESIISGRFTFGVHCNSNTGSIVEHLTIFDGVAAVKNCATVRENVVGPSSQLFLLVNFGIVNEGVGSNDSINKNYIEGRLRAIAGGSDSLEIRENVIHTDSSAAAIMLGDSTNGADGVAKFNIFFADGNNSSALLFNITGTDSLVYDGNYCNGDHPDCADCIADGRCEPYTSPFQGN